MKKLLAAATMALATALVAPAATPAAECGNGECERRELNSPRHCCLEDCGVCRTPGKSNPLTEFPDPSVVTLRASRSCVRLAS